MMGSKHRRIRQGRVVSALLGLVITAILVAVPAAAGGSDEAARHSTSSFWNEAGAPGAGTGGAKAYVRPDRFEAFTLDRGDLADTLAQTPSESARGSDAGLVLSLPDPNGGFQRFALEDSPIMEPALAAKHPEISTYRGRGLDDTRATIRADLTPLGFHASVRSPQGSWYIDPYYHLDDSLYVSYFARDLTENPHGVFVEREDTSGGGEDIEELLESAEAGPATGPQLRTYRLALVTDPTYATFFGGSANVTAAKVTLINRVTQIYEDETSIRLVLIGNNDLLNLDTEAQMTRGNGPCGETPCYTPAQATSCAGATLNRTRIVIGQIIGAANYDVGHIGLGNPGGGVASLGVVGGNSKAQGCTGPLGSGRRLLRRRLRRPRDRASVRRQPHVQRQPGELRRREPQRRELGRARQRLLDHGLRRHLPAGQHPAAQRPVLVAAELRGGHQPRHGRPASDQRGADVLAERLQRRRERGADRRALELRGHRLVPARLQRLDLRADRPRGELQRRGDQGRDRDDPRLPGRRHRHRHRDRQPGRRADRRGLRRHLRRDARRTPTSRIRSPSSTGSGPRARPPRPSTAGRRTTRSPSTTTARTRRRSCTARASRSRRSRTPSRARARCRP